MEKISVEKKPNLEEKESKLEAMRHVMENTGDGLGKGLDKGMIETCSLLNLLGYHTLQSCDGHGTHCAYIVFNTPTKHADMQDPNSADTIVSNASRDKADEKTYEKFGKEYLDSLDFRTQEQDDYWDNAYNETRDSHPLREEYQKSLNAFYKERDELVIKIKSLKDEFLDSINEPRDSIYLYEASGRIEFISEDNYNNEIENEETARRSDELLQKFEAFLKEKYLRS